MDILLDLFMCVNINDCPIVSQWLCNSTLDFTLNFASILFSLVLCVPVENHQCDND